MGRKRLLQPIDVMQIKERLWNGDPPAPMAVEFGISEPSLSSIKWGRKWPEIPWPDGSTGAISEERHQQLARMKTRELADKRAIKAGRRTSQYGPISSSNWRPENRFEELLNDMNAYRVRLEPPLPPLTLDQRKELVTKWKAREAKEREETQEAWRKRSKELAKKAKQVKPLTDAEKREALERDKRLREKNDREKLLIKDGKEWVINPLNPIINATDAEILAICEDLPDSKAVPILKKFIEDRHKMLETPNEEQPS